ncbi:hypothetical protein AJ80_09690 [Polytolypa hystricis UAMH7299]|uniref:Uncharacterized protein n=1 Tax=Polytolypa hystricis (strain UAMH7299) TaxID=1447883 RepID=A0A2B7WLY1_POLH7|nr:hypothetical protein AJ80_09690 [Polytolypa hystricis UAMH7299]
MPRPSSIAVPVWFADEKLTLHNRRQLAINDKHIGEVTQTEYCMGHTALSWAALNCRPDLVRRLIEHGFKIDSVDLYGMTPLGWAAAAASQTTVKILIDAGADVNLRGSGGLRPLEALKKFGTGSEVGAVKVILKTNRARLSWRYKVRYKLPDRKTSSIHYQLLKCPAIRARWSLPSSQHALCC